MSFISRFGKYADKHYKDVTGLALIAAGIITILYYIIFCGKTEMHADCMDTIMWANASYNSGSLFNKDFEYACLLPFGGQLLMQPFMLIFGLSYKVHIIGMVLFLIIFTASLVFMLRGMDLSWLKTGSTVFALLMTTCASAKLREIFWGHIIYYSLGLLFLFVGFGIVLRLIKKAQLKFNYLFALLFIWTLLCATDGIQALTIYILPISAGLAGFIILDFNEKLVTQRNKLIAVSIFIILLGTVWGMVILKLISADITQSYADAYSMFNNKDTWFDNLSNLLKCHYTLMGVDINSKMAIMSFSGIINLFRIIFATVIAFAPFFGLFFYTRLKNNGVKIFVIIYFTISFLILTGWVFGKISGANWRLTPIEVTGYILTILLIFELCSAGIYARLGFTMLIPVIIYSFIAFCCVFGISVDYENENKLFREIKLLEDNNCTYGYATFWNANPITVLTENKIKVRGVKIEDNVIAFRNYQSEKGWYTGETNPDERYFILLTEKEYDNFNTDGYPVKNIVKSDGYILIILDKNISFETTE